MVFIKNFICPNHAQNVILHSFETGRNDIHFFHGLIQDLMTLHSFVDREGKVRTEIKAHHSVETTILSSQKYQQKQYGDQTTRRNTTNFEGISAWTQKIGEKKAKPL
jgi:hypothetical protein